MRIKARRPGFGKLERCVLGMKRLAPAVGKCGTLFFPSQNVCVFVFVKPKPKAISDHLFGLFFPYHTYFTNNLLEASNIVHVCACE